ncbi:MAG: nucleotidyltransferase family protein [Chitinophagales bacterium]|nr:nucleotidyltransferase family protein [Chitinophagales bacterium]MDW8273677.1 nucleotidyltransferase family protein [Chitinophagales bacterium]
MPAATTAIILAGGMGTRLSSVVSDVPKPMAPVGNFPFLHYLFMYLKRQMISTVVLAVGYKYQAIKSYFGDNYEGLKIQYSIEEEPLGTGGAIKRAMDILRENCFLLNGDTFFEADLNLMETHALANNADLTIALSLQRNFSRYGIVTFDEKHRILSFEEKRYMTEGWINGGVYWISKNFFYNVEQIFSNSLPLKFSFETNILENVVKHLRLIAFLQPDKYFIDIGVPNDYYKAQRELVSLFLD